MSYPPTDEQQAAIDLARKGETFVIEAGAGTGKTSTLEFIALDQPDKQFAYYAFNKAIANEAQGRFPSNVAASTVHSLAFRHTGAKFSHRLKGGRMRGDEMARVLKLTPFDCEVNGQFKRLAAGFLAGLVKRAIERFCQTSDPEPTTVHVPLVPGLDEPVTLPNGEKVNRRGPNHVAMTMHIERAIKTYWADMLQENGSLPWGHHIYLKMFELSNPRVDADVLLVDEAQDLNPCLLSIVEQQRDAQVVYVGDAQQRIYTFTGAVNAMEDAASDAPRTRLETSFRFGPEIAEQANRVLSMLDTDMRLIGAGEPGTVGEIAEPDAILFRTNAGAVAEALARLDAGERVALVGGADDVIRFAEAADQLKRGGRCWHPDLQCFNTWGEVTDYVANDPSGSELKLLVDLVDKFGAEEIARGLRNSTDERSADIVISTAHKSKGRQWPAVKLGGDFPNPEKREVSDEEKRLLYVAATRAQTALDIADVAMLNQKEEM